MIPNSVTSIGAYAFDGCSGLTAVNIPNSVTSIGEYAFSYCSGLTAVNIPNSVTSIGESAFWDCSGLTSVNIPNSVTSIELYAFYRCSGLTSVTIPNSVTSIGEYAFSDCSGLTSVTIPNSVTYIGWYAFKGCSGLTSVTIPKSVTYIGESAFAKCSKIEEVYCYAEKVPSTVADAFQDSYPQYATLFVPANSINDYKTTAPWSEFGTFKTIEGGADTETKKCATPTIHYADKKLSYSCETEGVEYISEIKDVDIRKYYDGEISLTATYEISVYATKTGCENSDVATATLVWTEAVFTETTPSTPTSAKAVSQAVPLLITAQGGTVTIQSREAEGQTVSLYTIDGKTLGSASILGGQATIHTNQPAGTPFIVKAGARSVRMLMR